MTSTDDIADDIEQLSEQLLGDLDTRGRVTLAIEAQAVGDVGHLQRLKDTAEWKTYRQPEKEFQDALQQALLLSVRAMHDLDKRVSMFRIARLEGLYREQLARTHDVSEWDHIEEPSPENDFLEGEAMQEAARFLTTYWAWEEFAEDTLGVSLREFLLIGSPPESELDALEAMRDRATGEDLADAAADLDGETPDGTPLSDLFDEGALGWADDKTVEVAGEDLPPKEAASVYAMELKEGWGDGVGPGDGGGLS